MPVLSARKLLSTEIGSFLGTGIRMVWVQPLLNWFLRFKMFIFLFQTQPALGGTSAPFANNNMTERALVTVLWDVH
jgi:hypothetical protein